ncbi:uncharacterized protein LOC141630796 isoform X2 [Silene latifolia]|uniref:uncharacterized protein LOC141630796 isoform X2 n=1 Tax=Silene latifolia TaxID=37657 RepID=UPI003D77EE53
MKMDADHVPIFFDESFRKLNAGTIESHPNPTCLEQIELALLYENAPAFVELINNLPSHLLHEELNLILMKIVLWDSGKCAAAVLDGQTKITEIPLATSLLSQLHPAAASNAPKITALLLQRGISADVRCDYDSPASVGKLKNVLPLHVVMARLRSQVLCDNTEQESPARMLVRLCQPHYRRTLETVRLIALNTTEVKREFFNYLKEGKLIEVGALLLVAKSQVLLSPSTTAKGEGEEEGEFRSISEICDSAFVTELTINNEMRTLTLLEIFDKIGDKLAALVRLDFTQTCLAKCSTLLAASLIQNAGPFLVEGLFYHYSYTRSEAESYFLKGAIYACENAIRTSPVLPHPQVASSGEWRTPEVGEIKINTDAALFDDGTMGLGI